MRRCVKCRRCREPAVIEVRRHNAGFCRDCFLRYCREQVRRAIDDFDMIQPGERVLVAVSGGKDSLGLWHLLRELGYDADGLYVGLGIGEYSDASGALRARRSRTSTGGSSSRSTSATRTASTSPTARAPRSARRARACGLSKRHVFNQAAIDHGYDVLATGHNLDDEAAVLFGNVLRWEAGYLGRQHPVLPAAPGFARKVKPLVRLGERELAAYCVLHGHRLHRRGVPDGGRQPAPRLQGGARRDRGALAGIEGRVRVRLPRARASPGSRPMRSRSATSCAPCPSCGAPDTRPTSARSAGCRHGSRRTDRAGRREPASSRRATGSCSSTTASAATSSRSRRAASSTRTRASSTTTT